MNINFTRPTVEKAYTENGLLIVITRADRDKTGGKYYGWFDNINSHMDKRIIEYAQNGCHTYKEWDEFLKPLGYDSLWEQNFGISEKAIEEFRHWWNVEVRRDDWTEEMTESLLSERIHDAELHYNDPVKGIEFNYIPKGAIFKFTMMESRDEYGEYDGEYEDINIYYPEEFIISE